MKAQDKKTNSPYVKIEQLAEILHVCTRTIYRYIDSGMIPSRFVIRLGPRLLLFRQDAILAYLEGKTL